MMKSFILKYTTLGTQRYWFNKLPLLEHRQYTYISSSSHYPVRYQSSNNDKTDQGNDKDQAINKKGVIVDRFPVKICCEEGKKYSWCSCGLSRKQPWCDGTHKTSSCGLKPVRFTVAQTKEYFICNCKQSNKQPFCDGTHKKLT